MALTKLHTLSAVSFDTDIQDEAAVVVTGIRSSRVSPSINFQREITTGQAWAHFGSIYGASPMGTFSTIDVARCGAAIGLQGLNLASTGDSTGVTYFGVKKAKGGVRVSASEHVAFASIQGIAFLRGITAGHQTDAYLDVETLATSDNGTTAPLIETITSDYPTIPNDNERFTLGTLTLGVDSGSMVTFNQKSQVELIFNPTVEAFGSDSDIYPSIANITTFEPMLRITTLDVTLMNAVISMSGKVIDASNSFFYLRKRSKSSGTGFVANATAEHIKFTLTDGCAYQMTAFESTSPAGNAQAIIEVPLIGDSETFPLAVSWASAIT